MMQLGDAIRRLKDTPEWAVVRKLIEDRAAQCRSTLLKPCSDLPEMVQAEREKAAAIALEGILFLFDTTVPLPMEHVDEDSADRE